MTSVHPLAGSALATARCGICHAGAPPVLNGFGAEVQKALRAANSRQLTDAVLARVAAIDSDGDGTANSAELAAGTLPADWSSRPQRIAPAKPKPLSAVNNLVPAHSFHPLIVHFPVALLLVGAILEVLGARKRRPELRSAGFLNISVAAVISVAAIITGLTALFRQGMPISGVPLIHLSLGTTASIAMLLVAGVGWAENRKGAGRSTPLYWGLLGFAFLTVAAAGHFGSVLVFG